MFGDQKPREFGYVQHQDHYPLELKGNMRRKKAYYAKEP